MEQAILKKIKQLRTENNVKPQDIADYLGIDVSAYKRLENGENHTWGKYFLSLTEFYKITPTDFFKDIEGKNFIQQTNTDFKDQSVGVMVTDKVMYSDKPIVKSLLDQKDKTIELLEEKISVLNKEIDSLRNENSRIHERMSYLEAEMSKLSGK